MKFNFFSEDDDVPLPKYIVRRESIGYSSRKVWTVRERNGENSKNPCFFYDGNLYFLHKTYETVGLFYNNKMFEENKWDVPKTIQELEMIADKMIKMDIVPFAAGSADWRQTSEWFVSIVFNSVDLLYIVIFDLAYIVLDVVRSFLV